MRVPIRLFLVLLFTTSLGLIACGSETRSDRGGGGGGGEGGEASCDHLPDCEDPQMPAAGEVDGPYLFTFSASFDPTMPVLFHADLTTQDGAQGLELYLELQPLNAHDRQSRVGATFNRGPYLVSPEHHCYQADLGVIDMPGEANPFSDKPLIVSAILDGKLCRSTDFLCGTLDGDVTAPIALPLEGSTYTFDRVVGASYPEPPLVNCDREEARPAPLPP